MEAQTLVISNKIKSIDGLVEDRRNILLLDDYSSKNILDALLPIIDNPERYIEISTNGKNLVLSSHCEKLAQQSLKDLYHRKIITR